MLHGCFSATSVLSFCTPGSKGAHGWCNRMPTPISWEQFRPLLLICKHVNLMLEGVQACHCHWLLGM